MPTIDVDFEIWCSCGEGLCNQTSNKKGGIEVEPCQKCLDEAEEKGYKEGYDKGYEDRIKDE